MFSIIYRVMSRVTHSEPGLPMVYVQRCTCTVLVLANDNGQRSERNFNGFSVGTCLVDHLLIFWQIFGNSKIPKICRRPWLTVTKLEK